MTAATAALSWVGIPNRPSAEPMPGEFGHRRSQVRDEHRDDREGPPADTPPLADEPHQSLAGRQPQPRADLLGEEQDDLGPQQDPQEGVAELRAGQAVRRDPAGVVVGEPAHEAGPEDGERRQQSDAPVGEPRQRRQDPRTRPPATRRHHRGTDGGRPREPRPRIGSVIPGLIAGVEPARDPGHLSYRLKTRGRRFFQAVGMTVSIASSTVTIPTSRSSSSTTGTASRL